MLTQSKNSINPFWTEKKVLITGGRGFLGTHLAKRLTELGASLYCPSKHEYDLRNQDHIWRMLHILRPEIIIHCAAVTGGIGINDSHASDFYYDNAQMGLNLMHLAWKMQVVSKFVTIGTVCEYPFSTPVPFKEDDLWKGYPEEVNSYYAMAKKMLLVQGNAYRKQNGFNSIHLLMTNLYGPGDRFDAQSGKVVATSILKILAAKRRSDSQIEFWGHPLTTRDFLYIDDAVTGIIQATEHYDESPPVNIASGEACSIAKLQALISDLLHHHPTITYTGILSGQAARVCDISRATEKFGFAPRTPLEAGLKETIEWWKRKSK